MYILGIDCGGTSTKALLVTTEGCIIGRGQGGPANYTVDGVDGVVKSVLEAVRGCLGQTSLDLPTLQQAGVFLALGVSGAGRQTEAEAVEEAFRGLGFEQVVADHDATIALFGALGGADGVVVIAGTGSISCGLHNGKRGRVGGWGYLLGDEGSAFWMGIRALQQVMRGFDGRANVDQLLLRAVCDYFQVQDATELVPLIHKAPLDRGLIGGFSKEITSLANRGHSLCQTIVAEAGRELGQLAVAVLAELDLLEAEGKVGACGGVFAAGDLILTPMQEEIRRWAPGQILSLPDFEPVEGAVLLAARHFKLDLDRIKGGLS